MRNDEQHESISDCKGLRQKKNGSPCCTGLRHICSSDRILFVNNTCFDLFVSQLFTDEMVSLPR